MTMQVITGKPGSPEHCGLCLPTNVLPEFVLSQRIPIGWENDDKSGKNADLLPSTATDCHFGEPREPARRPAGALKTATGADILDRDPYQSDAPARRADDGRLGHGCDRVSVARGRCMLADARKSPINTRDTAAEA